MKITFRADKRNLFILIFVLSQFFIQSALASSAPLIYSNNLEYIGAFKVPADESMSYGGSVITYNATNNSLFIVGHTNAQEVAEISIPTIVNSNDLATLNRSGYHQSFSDITEGNLRNISKDGQKITSNAVNLGGLLKYNERLIGSAYAYYSYDAVLSHFSSSTTLSSTGDFMGMYAVGSAPEVPTASFVSGWLSNIPIELQDELGGPVLAGNGTLSILNRTSFGPSAFSFDPANLNSANPASATALFYYPSGHQTLNLNGYNNPYFNDTTKIAGMTMINGSRSILYFGYHGIGEDNYGQWSNDPIYADTCIEPDVCTLGSKGWPICEDPSNCTTGRKGIPFDPQCAGSGVDGCYFDPTGMGAKGPHAYPYIYQAWAYDANDLVKVKTGEITNPWEVLPYAIWQLPFPANKTHLFGGATAYDPVTNRIFISQPNGEQHGCCLRLPVIHVFQVNLSATPSAGYQVKGKVTLLDGTVKLDVNNSEEITITSNDRTVLQEFSFQKPVAVGAGYNVTITEQPTVGRKCKVMHGSGTMNANADINNIVVLCNVSLAKPSPPTHVQVE